VKRREGSEGLERRGALEKRRAQSFKEGALVHEDAQAW
jgi:hypothetical protein